MKKLMLMLALGLSTMTYACGDDDIDDAEDVGEEIDDAADDFSDNVDEAAEFTAGSGG